jgi:arginase family enzyme
MPEVDAARPIRVIGVASGLGAPAWANAGCAEGPETLKKAGLVGAARRNGRECLWQETLVPAAGTATEALPPLLDALAERVANAIVAGQLPLVIGGDQSIAPGTWRGVARAAARRAPGREIGLLWIDAHADVQARVGAHTANLNRMALAALMGIHVAGLGDLDSTHLFTRCLLYTSPSPRDRTRSRMPSSA